MRIEIALAREEVFSGGVLEGVVTVTGPIGYSGPLRYWIELEVFQRSLVAQEPEAAAAAGPWIDLAASMAGDVADLPDRSGARQTVPFRIPIPFDAPVSDRGTRLSLR
ncbi:MAG: hypothetical protein GX442_23880 [Candidatus Riflebacteria bacterium]|nr:hypothetical protein [Candidatus Riflebacteria bacterium]